MENDSISLSRRCKKVSREQKLVLIEFLEKHPELVRKKVYSQSDYGVPVNFDTKPLWIKLKSKLESCSTGASNRLLEEWKKTWSDLKRKALSTAENVRSSRRTRAGNTDIRALSPFTGRVVSLIASASEQDHQAEQLLIADKQQESIKEISDPHSIVEVTMDNIFEEYIYLDNADNCNNTTANSNSNTNMPLKADAEVQVSSRDVSSLTPGNSEPFRCNIPLRRRRRRIRRHTLETFQLINMQNQLLRVQKQRNKIDLIKLKLLRRNHEENVRIANALESLNRSIRDLQNNPHYIAL